MHQQLLYSGSLVKTMRTITRQAIETVPDKKNTTTRLGPTRCLLTSISSRALGAYYSNLLLNNCTHNRARR